MTAVVESLGESLVAADHSVRMASVGADLPSTRLGGDLQGEMEFGNHLSVNPWAAEVWDKIVADAAAERALVFAVPRRQQCQGRGGRPMGVVHE